MKPGAAKPAGQAAGGGALPAARYLTVPRGDKGLSPAAAASGTAGKRIGLYGGSFNPPHSGHLLVAETALRRLKLDYIWWLVSPGNPLKDKSDLAPLGARAAQAQALAETSAFAAKIKITAFEQTLGTHGTADMLRFIVGENPRTHFVWLMGADNMAEFHRWQNWRLIMETAPIAVINRPHYNRAAEAGAAARAFAAARLEEARAAELAEAKPPAWLFLRGRRSYLSSSALRAQRGKTRKNGDAP